MNYKKMLLFSLLISNSAFSLDLQNKFRNSDKSLFETISDYQTIDPGRVMFSTGYSLQSRPLVDPASKSVLVDGLTEIDFSMITGITKKWELGIVAPMTTTTVTDASPLQSFSGFSDVYFESKFRLFNNFAIVPTYILQTGDGLATSGSNSGGYGIKIVGSFFEDSYIPLYYSIGRYYVSGTESFGIDQSERTQVSIGTLKNLTKEISVGMEFFNDIAKKKQNSKELMAHATINTKFFSVRTGMGSGFLNSDRQNETRFFASLIFDLDFRKNKQLPEMTIPRDPNDMLFSQVDKLPNGTYLNRMPNSLENEKIPTKEEVKKQMQEFLNKSSISKELKESNDLNEYTILPFYSTMDTRKPEKQNIAEKTSDQLTDEESKLIEDKYKRLQNGYKNLDYNVDIYTEQNKMSVIKELNWALRVVNMRKNTMKDLQSQFKDKNTEKYSTELNSHSVQTEKEQKALDILRAEQEVLNQLVNSSKKISIANVELKKISPKVDKPLVSEVPKKESTTVKPKDLTKNETEEQRVERLTKAQQAEWARSKNETYSDMLRKKRGLKKIDKPIPVIAAPQNDLKEKELPASSEVIEEKPTEIIKEVEIVTAELPKDKTEDTHNTNLVHAEITVVDQSDKKEVVSRKENEQNVESLTVPALTDLVELPSPQDQKNLDQKVQELLNKIQTKKIENENGYTKFYEQYQKSVEESKAVEKESVDLQNKNKELKVLIYQNPEKDLQKMQNIIDKSVQNKQEGDNTIELQDFKVNSIEARFEEYKRKKREQEAVENEPSQEVNVNSEEGLMESGEIEFSTGPSY